MYPKRDSNETHRRSFTTYSQGSRADNENRSIGLSATSFGAAPDSNDGSSLLGRISSMFQSLRCNLAAAWTWYQGWSEWIESHANGDPLAPITYCWGVVGSATNNPNEVILWCVECGVEIVGDNFVGTVIVSRELTAAWAHTQLPLYGMLTRDGVVDAWRSVRFAIWQRFVPVAQIKIRTGIEGTCVLRESRVVGTEIFKVDLDRNLSDLDNWKEAVAETERWALVVSDPGHYFLAHLNMGRQEEEKIKVKVSEAFCKMYQRSINFAREQGYWNEDGSSVRNC